MGNGQKVPNRQFFQERPKQDIAHEMRKALEARRERNKLIVLYSGMMARKG